MGVKVKGVSRVSRNVNRAIDSIQDRRVIRALTGAMIVGAAQASLYTPIDTNTLINSQFREIVVNGALITGRVGYTASYAAYVHDPAIPQRFRRPTAQKEFLTKGFEESRDAIERVIHREMTL